MKSKKKRIRAGIRKWRRNLTVYKRAMADPRCPRVARWLLAGAIAYAVSPIDLIPDFIPVIGHLDDVIIVPVMIWLALRMIPETVLVDLRQRVLPHRDR